MGKLKGKGPIRCLCGVRELRTPGGLERRLPRTRPGPFRAAELPESGAPDPRAEEVGEERTAGGKHISSHFADSPTQPGLSKSCRGAFRSPRPSPKSDQANGASKDSLHLDIQKLKEKKDMLDKEISQLISEGYSVDELEDHISQLHEYNDIKDVGQMLLGKLAMIRGVTTKELYPEFDLNMND
nr:DNA repair protein SWI5 homolog [Kogia breviceps]